MCFYISSEANLRFELRARIAEKELVYHLFRKLQWVHDTSLEASSHGLLDCCHASIHHLLPRSVVWEKTAANANLKHGLRA